MWNAIHFTQGKTGKESLLQSALNERVFFFFITVSRVGLAESDQGGWLYYKVTKAFVAL